MNEPYNWIRQRRKIGQGVLEEDSPKETTTPIEEQTERIKEINEEVMEEKIGVDPMQEETIVLKPLKRSFRTIRKRKKIGEELIETEIEEQKAKIKKQIKELPKEHRKTFLEELLERVNK